MILLSYDSAVDVAPIDHLNLYAAAALLSIFVRLQVFENGSFCTNRDGNEAWYCVDVVFGRN